MKRIVLMLFVAVGLFAMPSCKEEAEKDYTKVMEDSLATVLPTWQSVKVNVQNKTYVDVIVGDLGFYSAAPEVRAQKAKELGGLLLRLYKGDNYFEKGNMIITKDPKNTDMAPKDGVSTPIPFGELKK